MKPLDNTFAKLNAQRQPTAGARRGRRLIVMSSHEEADSFPVEVRHLRQEPDGSDAEAPATGPADPREVPRQNSKEK